MKEKVFILSTAFDFNRLMTELKTTWRQAITDKKPLVVRLSNKQEDITSAQRRLYFMWCGQFATNIGNDKDDQHHDFKRRFLIAIYRRDDAGFAAMCDSIAKLKTSEPEEFQAIGEQVIKLTSITKATKQQMTEFMDQIFRFCAGQGVLLRVPDDLRFAREMSEK